MDRTTVGWQTINAALDDEVAIGIPVANSVPGNQAKEGKI